MRLLLFSNSSNAGEEYMAYTLPYIKDFIKDIPKHALFIPYAAVTITFNEYYSRVAQKFQELGVHIQSIHDFPEPKKAIQKADLLIVGGGNTFHLLKMLQDFDLLADIQAKVLSGVPYIGWSAGSNLACPTIRTTNDMPIIEPNNFNALNLIPFQINPHYSDANPEGHAGETREMRINEFIEVNKTILVTGLREGTLFRIEGDSILLLGEKACRIFKYGESPKELRKSDDFRFLLQ